MRNMAKNEEEGKKQKNRADGKSDGNTAANAAADAAAGGDISTMINMVVEMQKIIEEMRSTMATKTDISNIGHKLDQLMIASPPSGLPTDGFVVEMQKENLVEAAVRNGGKAA